MTKAQQIRALYAQGLTTREIADRIGCNTEYVRVCARQRIAGLSEIDKRYRAKVEEETGRPYWRRHAHNRQKHSAYYSVRRRLERLGHSTEFAKQKGREAYAAAK